MRLRRVCCTGLVLLFAAVLAACQPTPQTVPPVEPQTVQVTPTPASRPSTGAPVATPSSTRTPTPSPTPPPALIPGGRVVQGGLYRVSRVDPRSGDLNPAEQQVADLLFESLFVPSPLDGRPEPALAEDWAFSADGLEVTFHLREGVRWHDGAPLTAGDVARALEEARDPAGGGTLWPFLKPVLSVEALGARDIRVAFRGPDCWAFWTLGQVPLMRQDAEGRPVGTGPFRWAGQEADGRVALEAFRAYWGPPPYLDGWIYQPFPDAGSLEQALGAGAVDLALWPEKDASAV
ncbi:MAG: ABC transporter substrate-binding protein, partial [Anaerolineae bacterium]